MSVSDLHYQAGDDSPNRVVTNESPGVADAGNGQAPLNLKTRKKPRPEQVAQSTAVISQVTTEDLKNQQDLAYENDDFEKDEIVNVDIGVGRPKKRPTKLEQRPAEKLINRQSRNMTPHRTQHSSAKK